MSPTPPPHPGADALLALATAADARFAGRADAVVLGVHQTSPGTDCLTWVPLGGRHPYDALAGTLAPSHWRAIGVCARGIATGAAGTDGAVVTLLVDRGGASASVLRRGTDLTPLPGRPDGIIADACRRALAFPTAPPPPSTVGLWTRCWLDRVVELASDRVPGLTPSWADVARLHPAGGAGPGADGAVPGPVALATAAASLAEAWPWAQLRAAPGVVDVPGGAPDAAVSTWMDDGMWARWVLGAFPALGDLVAATRALLAPLVADAVELVVTAGLGDRGA